MDGNLVFQLEAKPKRIFPKISYALAITWQFGPELSNNCQWITQRQAETRGNMHFLYR